MMLSKLIINIIIMMDADNNHLRTTSWHRVFEQTIAILLKNMHNSVANKTKLASEFIFPILISAIYAITEIICPGSALTTKLGQCEQILTSTVLNLLLVMYVGMIGTSGLRELVVLFISERNEQFRQYQMIFGVSFKTHTLANLLYMKIYLSVTILPFYLTLNYFHFHPSYILYFAAFVISSSYLTLALTAFFQDQKIALEVIGLFYSLTSFLPFFYDKTNTTALNYIIQIIPNCSFTIAVQQKDLTISLMSLSLVKIYVLVYLLIQFRQAMLSKVRECCGYIREHIPTMTTQNNVLMEQFENNQIGNHQQEQPNPATNIIIKTQALSKQYYLNDHQFFALNRLSIQIRQSQIFGLLGRNGAGKTTLVDILTKVTKQTSGTVEIANINGLGICYQHQILYENLTIRQHLNIYSRLKNLDSGQHGIQQVVEMLRIEGEVDKKVKDLSGGNKRKLSIAIAILGRPEVLIFDEPTSGLDPLSRSYIWQVLLELKRRKSTIILTTHHLDQAQRLADTICVIQRGTCIVQNTPQFIKQKYGKGFHFKIFRKDQSSNSPICFDKHRLFLESIKLKAFQIQSTPNYLHLLVKPDNNGKEGQFQECFQDWIDRLEQDVEIDFRFHSNTLEESFMAILRDEEDNSGQSLSDERELNRHLNAVVSQGIVKWLCQIWAVVKKNFYYRKSILLQSLTLYNLNIIIVLLYYAINHILQQNVSQGRTNQDKVTQQHPNLMMLLQGYVTMATVFITSPVYQTEKKISSVLSARGLMRSCLWIGNFLFDYTAFLFNLFLLKYAIAPAELAAAGAVEISLMGASTIVYAYCASKMFSKLKTANTWFSVFNMLFGLIIMLIIILAPSNSFLQIILPIKYFYPFYNLTKKSMLNTALSAKVPLGTHQSTTIITLIIYIIILFLIEMHPLERLRYYCSSNTLSPLAHHEIELQTVTKKYGKTTALQNINYSINQQRVALLGHNGAGKSTTFSLLTLQIQPTEGAVYVFRKLAKPFERVLESAGVCYQQDALWEQMRVEQIIEIFKWIVPIQNGQQEANWFFRSLQFEATNVLKRFSALSGGNKRKLCLLVALFGNPQMRLLDECSTGLDPSSRVAMMSTIKHSKSGSTLFTTHSMSEAQRLCSKAIIMREGRVIQFEFIQKLIAKHFQCVWIDIALEAHHKKQCLESIIPSQLQTAYKITVVARKIRLQVNKSVRASQVLAWIRHAHQKGIIASYSWAQPLLEDVYIKLTCQYHQGHQQVM